jgi:hypothetical protein
MFRAGSTILVSFALCLAAATASAAAPPGPDAAPRADADSADSEDGSVQWLMPGKALAKIAEQPGVRDALDRPSTSIITGPGYPVPAGWSAKRVISFTSYQKLHEVLNSGHIPPGTRSVLYDSEKWSFTPMEEQLNPWLYTALAAADAHAHGLTLIAMPATTLTQVIAPGAGPVYRRFLDARIIASVATSADSVVILASGSQNTPVSYANFVREATAQARLVNPNIVVLAGLSTNPPGPVVTLKNLVDSVRLTRDVVDGYNMNIPDPGPYCPLCNPSRPDLAVALLLDPVTQDPVITPTTTTTAAPTTTTAAPTTTVAPVPANP